MFNNNLSITRRHLLKLLASGALLFLGGRSRIVKAAQNSNLNMLGKATTDKKSRVVIARNEAVLDATGKPRKELLRQMVDESLKRLVKTNDLKKAWSQFVLPTDIIGVKVNATGYPTTSTELAYALTDSLMAAGLQANNIILFGQMKEGLQKAGFTLNETGDGIRCYATNSIGKTPFGQVERLFYDFTSVSYGSAKSRLSKIFSTHCSAVINMPVLKDHYITGVTATMKNLFGVINNPKTYHPNQGNPYIADLNCVPQINQKIKLNVVDLLRPLYDGGPAGHPGRQWPFKGIMMGTDRVALDYLGWQMIEKKRQELGHRSLAEEGRQPLYIETAAKNGLGNADPANIEIVELDFS